MADSYIILGACYGDEGKGKLTDELMDQISDSIETPLVTRFNGGANAGHTVKHGDKTYYTHLIPSGILTEKALCFIGNGVVVSLVALEREINDLNEGGIVTDNRIFISDRAHVTFLIHCLLDQLMNESIGTTKQGIGNTYADKMNRIGLTIGDLLKDNYENKLRRLYGHYEALIDDYLIRKMRQKLVETHSLPSDFTVDNLYENEAAKNSFIDVFEIADRDGYLRINFEFKNEKNEVEKIDRLDSLFSRDLLLIENFRRKWKDSIVNGFSFMKSHMKSRMIIEGANAIMLDIDCGTYPYVTSSNCGIGGVLTGLSLSLKVMSKFKVIGVFKSYITRVGGGCLPTEQDNEIGEMMQTLGHEFGVTTKRKRRCGWLDLVQLKYSCQVNGYDYLNITKLDILNAFEQIKVCTAYKSKYDVLIEDFPSDEDRLKEVTPMYVTFDGWKDFDISKCTNWKDLHANIRNFIKFIEAYTNVPIKYINTGQEKGAMIIRDV
uniref:Adenylosuccinate synthase n=1 Tax=viral metagenome TaxID=1070528 RepID=A0A6C0EAE3_9ZZZZ